jgi:hypothetical protein
MPGAAAEKMRNPGFFAKKLRSQKRKKLQSLSNSLARDILFIIIEEKRFSVILRAIFCAESDMLYTFCALHTFCAGRNFF